MKPISTIRLYQFVILALVLVILFLKMCSGKKCPSVEVVKIETDTQYVKVTETVERYMPPVTKYIPYNNIIYKTDSLVEYQFVDVDTAAILKDYFATRFYSDTIRNDYGYIVIPDSVRENRIVSRAPKWNLSIPIVTNTITVKEKERNQIYLGLTGIGNKDNIYPGASLMLKTKKDFIIEGGALIGTDGKLLYQGGMKFLIRVKIN